ncbi:MAG: bacillithiol biosynthesis deacetylase BshB1 [Chitinophagales bacterium]
MVNTIDLLAIGAHPDDVELSASGTLLRHAEAGYRTGIIDLTEGELGTRGTAETRRRESAAAAEILGVAFRENMGFRDGFFQNDEEHQLALIKVLRKYRPTIVLANAITDRHPDHGRAAALVRDAVFLAGLAKIETSLDGQKQEAFRPQHCFHYVQSLDIAPDFVVDISDFMEQKLASIKAYATQFYNPDSKEATTFISTPEFLEFVRARAVHHGVPAGCRYAEAFTASRPVAVKDLFSFR